MSNYQSKNQDFMLDMQRNIRRGLNALDKEDNWLDAYDAWSEDNRNQFTVLLRLINPFNLNCAGDSLAYDETDESDMAALDVMRMSVFLSEHLVARTHEVFSRVRMERTREKKLTLIRNYFSLVDNIRENPELSGCITTLHEAAEKQMVLQGNRSEDLYTRYYSLFETIKKRSTESLYLLFTEWRITRNKKTLKLLTEALIEYIRTYFYDFNHDPDMHLYAPLDGLMIMKKLSTIECWLRRIAFHTDKIFEKYKELEWLCQADCMADDIIGTNQISQFEMLQYKRIFSNDDDDNVKKKAICNHSYAIWIKTVDVMHIVCEVFHVLYNYTDEDLKKMNTSKAVILDLYDNMTKTRDFYTRKVFFHQVYFRLERNYLDSQVMEALEDDADMFTESVDDMLKFIEAISADNIEELSQAKQKYISRLKDFTTEEQEEKLDELTYRITEKIREAISKKDIYDELYGAVSNEFNAYATSLMRYPKIFSSLVSAEYLYKQYVDTKEPNERFDYSCISIMYYMALEDFVNSLIYIPYKTDILQKIDKKDLADKKWIQQESGKYVSSFYKFWDGQKRVMKKTCEIGVLGFLFEGIQNEEKLESYLHTRYPRIDITKVKIFGKKLKEVAPRRNSAAHGGNYLTYNDVCKDKENVYNSVDSYRGLILELMEILFS